MFCRHPLRWVLLADEDMFCRCSFVCLMVCLVYTKSYLWFSRDFWKGWRWEKKQSTGFFSGVICNHPGRNIGLSAGIGPVCYNRLCRKSRCRKILNRNLLPRFALFEWFPVYFDRGDAIVGLSFAFRYFRCKPVIPKTRQKLEMWANAQRRGRPAEHRWRPLFNAAKFGWRSLLDAVQ